MEIFIILYLSLIITNLIPQIQSASSSSPVANTIKYRMLKPEKFLNDRKDKGTTYDGIDGVDDDGKSIEGRRMHALVTSFLIKYCFSLSTLSIDLGLKRA